jgi:hypothetical protein
MEKKMKKLYVCSLLVFGFLLVFSAVSSAEQPPPECCPRTNQINLQVQSAFSGSLVGIFDLSFSVQGSADRKLFDGPESSLVAEPADALSISLAAIQNSKRRVLTLEPHNSIHSVYEPLEWAMVSERRRAEG